LNVSRSFGVDAERYDRARPAYPDALIDRIADRPGRVVLDVGCGTGTAARQFQGRGGTVLGVEPDPRMAEVARRRGLDVESSTFETWDPAGRTFDAVVAGTSWHWVDPVAGAAKAAGVLRPGGRLAAFWHTYELPMPIAEAFADVHARVWPDAPFTVRASVQGVAAFGDHFANALAGMRAAGGLGDPQEWRYDWERRYTRDEWLDQLPTLAVLTRLPADRVAQVVAGVGAAIDALGGAFTLPYTTIVVTAAAGA
jgi:SAM-dependent methyltransferase